MVMLTTPALAGTLAGRPDHPGALVNGHGSWVARDSSRVMEQRLGTEFLF
jgi:hypothetical protein